MTLIYNATFDKNTRKLSFEDRAGNEIYSFTVPERGPAVDDITKPLTFRATQNGSTVKLTYIGSPSGRFQTSRDGGNTWTNYPIGSSITLNTGDEVSFRAKTNRTSAQGNENVFYFVMKGKIEAWHNVMSLYRTNDFATYESVVEYAFDHLFWNCTSLTKAPVLPATTLAYSCYTSLFAGCKSLTKAPELPATTLADYCYWCMFARCKSLTKAPELPATTLANYCYSNMFLHCQSLTKAPELPVTTLATNCYEFMFFGCKSLTKAPELPATTLADRCYDSMFSGCQSLNEVRISATTTATDALKEWLEGASATGDFYCDPNATIFPAGTSGIPNGWRRLNINEEAPAVDDITKPLTFKATQDGSTVTLTNRGSTYGGFQTSRDGGNTWTDYILYTAITLNTGDEVSFRAKAHRTTRQSRKDFSNFHMTGKIEAWHNVRSLWRTNDFATYNTLVESAFTNLFYNCKSLIKAPVLPSTTLAKDCYSSMFRGCQSLTEAPELPATKLVSGCYDSMFEDCQSLTKAPELPATTLSMYCYQYMFYRCRSLAKAPELPATTLEPGCYRGMFSGCQSLKEVRVSATTTTATDALTEWLLDVSATGDFYCNPNAVIFTTDSESGIPANWTRRNIADYPN